VAEHCFSFSTAFSRSSVEASMGIRTAEKDFEPLRDEDMD
jgi:hypothetical protein